jgi:hypothetical protein
MPALTPTTPDTHAVPVEPSSVRSPLASTTPPPLSFAAVRAIAHKPGATLPPGMLLAMRAVLVTQGSPHLAAELEQLFDLETGRSRV